MGDSTASRDRRRSDPSELSQFLAKMGAKWQPPSSVHGANSGKDRKDAYPVSGN